MLIKLDTPFAQKNGDCIQTILAVDEEVMHLAVRMAQNEKFTLPDKMLVFMNIEWVIDKKYAASEFDLADMVNDAKRKGDYRSYDTSLTFVRCLMEELVKQIGYVVALETSKYN